jgi:hypothetical protein
MKMKKKNIFLILLIVFVTGIITFIGIRLYNANESMKMSKEISSFLDDEKNMNMIIRKFGEPTMRIPKAQSPVVEYYHCKMSNTGNVLIWDRRKWIGGSYVLVISFDEGTNKIGCQSMAF